MGEQDLYSPLWTPLKKKSDDDYCSFCNPPQKRQLTEPLAGAGHEEGETSCCPESIAAQAHDSEPRGRPSFQSKTKQMRRYSVKIPSTVLENEILTDYQMMPVLFTDESKRTQSAERTARVYGKEHPEIRSALVKSTPCHVGRQTWHEGGTDPDEKEHITVVFSDQYGNVITTKHLGRDGQPTSCDWDPQHAWARMSNEAFMSGGSR